MFSVTVRFSEGFGEMWRLQLFDHGMVEVFTVLYIPSWEKIGCADLHPGVMAVLRSSVMTSLMLILVCVSVHFAGKWRDGRTVPILRGRVQSCWTVEGRETRWAGHLLHCATHNLGLFRASTTPAQLEKKIRDRDAASRV